ncbi:MAG: hypothetical protein AB1758_21690, partial [Candidatus Eremiobacterota bacterium]
SFPGGDAEARLALSPTGDVLALGSGSLFELRLFGVLEEAPLVTFTLPDPTAFVAFDPAGERLLAVTKGGLVQAYRRPKPALASVEHPGRPVAVSFAPDPEQAVTVDEDGTVRLWDPDDRALAREMAGVSPFSGRVEASRRWVLVDGLYKGLVLYSREGAGREVPGRAGVVAPDEKRLAYLDSQGRPTVLELARGSPRVLAEDECTAVEWVTDQRLLALRTRQMACLLDATGVRVVDEIGPGERLLGAPWLQRAVLLGQHGVLVVGPDGLLSRFALRSPHASAVTSDGLLAASLRDGPVRLVDLADGRPQGGDLPFPVMPTWVKAGGRWLVTTTDSRFRLWDTRSGQAASPWMAVPESLEQVALSPSGDWLALVARGAPSRMYVLDLR